jgi:hypothetical protein
LVIAVAVFILILLPLILLEPSTEWRCDLCHPAM